MHSPNWDSPRLFPRVLALLGPSPLFLELCPWDFYPMPNPPGLSESIFCFCRASTMMGWTSIVPRRPLSPSACYTLVFCPQWHCPVGLAFAVLDTAGPLPSQVRYPGLRRIWFVPEGFLHPLGLGNFRGLNPLLGIPSQYPPCLPQTMII
jgi:hypothetical protein